MKFFILPFFILTYEVNEEFFVILQASVFIRVHLWFKFLFRFRHPSKR
jgi:hypothetical protein